MLKLNFSTRRKLLFSIVEHECVHECTVGNRLPVHATAEVAVNGMPFTVGSLQISVNISLISLYEIYIISHNNISMHLMKPPYLTVPNKCSSVYAP